MEFSMNSFQWMIMITKHCPNLGSEENKNYALVITTNAGLWRYLIEDTITFTNTQPYRFKITGRISQFLNTFGEELMIDNTDKALSIACKNRL